MDKRVLQHVGRIYVLEEAIANGRGKIKVGDALWTVEGPELAAGARVKVVATREQMLVVEGVDREP
jgi:inner membrane protein